MWYLLHQAVGLHAHDFAATSGEHNHDAGSDELAFIWKCLVVVAAIYAFFLVESLMHMSGVSILKALDTIGKYSNGLSA